MYLKEIVLENVGPISYLNKKTSFDADGNPKPLVIIGQNGAGKSIVVSNIVNALINAKQSIYDDNEVEDGKVYKYRSPSYIKSGNSYSFSKVIFENNFYQTEWQIDREKKDFEEQFKYTPAIKEWTQIPETVTSHLDSSFHNDNIPLKQLFEKNCVLYFPPNRFEEPGWLNYDNLINRADYRFIKRLTNLSNRTVINYSPLKDNQNWLLDLLFDKYALEFKTGNFNVPINSQGQQAPQIQNVPVPLFLGFHGESNSIYNEVLNFLKVLFQTNETLRFAVGKRRDRQIQILKNEELWIHNLFNLSTGETILLNIFLTIIKDFDLTRATFQSLAEIRGIVIIDEVDIHLHSNLQFEVLPKLIKLFPKIQFILTSHSPLFLLGLEKELGQENVEIINMPEGEEISVESFSEFEKAYSYFKNSIKYKTEIKEEIAKSHKSLLFIEGDYDVRYLEKAASLFGKEELLNYFKLVDSEGHGNITNVSKHFDSKLSEVTPQKILLLYDCDVKKKENKNGNVYKRVMPTIESNPIKKGIENLFPKETIEKAKTHKKAFIDITPELDKLERGEIVKIPEIWEVNKNEKKNLCDWITQNGTKEDFKNFKTIFEILEAIRQEKLEY